jgi:hypothetical protein
VLQSPYAIQAKCKLPGVATDSLVEAHAFVSLAILYFARHLHKMPGLLPKRLLQLLRLLLRRLLVLQWLP